jgi:hypothetical protein
LTLKSFNAEPQATAPAAIVMPRDDSSDDINPYAPPAVPDPLLPLHAGPGVWRDGYFVVMHQESELPLVCVKTGLACRQRVRVEVFPMQLSKMPRRIAVPLASWWRIWAVYCREHVMLLGIGLVFGAQGLDSGMKWIFGGDFLVANVFAAGAIFVILALCGMFWGSPLDCVRSDGPYFWLRGACPRFLENLPEWPG